VSNLFVILDVRQLVMKRALRNIRIALALLLIGGLGFVSLSAYRTYRTATERLKEFEKLGLSINPTTEFEALRRRYGTDMRPTEGCTQRLCQYELDLSNQPISALRIVPYTEMNLWYTVYEGSLQ
jgi:hypothetical protein